MAVKSQKGINLSVTKQELSAVYDVAFDVLDNLPSSAVDELFGGSRRDLDNLFTDFLFDINSIINSNGTIISEYGGLDNFSKQFEESLKIQSYNYFKSTMLPNFNQGWRNLEMGNMFQMYPWSAYLAARMSGKSYEGCFAFPLWRMYRYRKPPTFTTDTWDNKNSKETVLITNESKLGKKHLEKITSEVQNNDLLAERLKPDKGVKGIEKFTAKNGALVELRSFGSAIRGLHVGAVVVDDFLDKSALYSAEQREKFLEVFNAEIKGIVEPFAYLLVTGTPFSKNDLYSHLKEDPEFRVFEYPAIYPDGQLLAPDRLTYKKLMELRRSLGSIVFAREFLVTPIDDSSSIFPWEYLNRAFIGMDHIRLVENIESYPIKMERVVLGCDFALSANTGADYSVFSVWGIDKDKRYYLISYWRQQGASFNTQINQIVKMNNLFKPNTIVCEDNGFQNVMLTTLEERGIVNAKGFTTGNNKKDLYDGLPSLSAAFERGEIKIPYGDERSKNVAQQLCGEFNSIIFDDDRGKLESADGHDDGPMSTWFAIGELKENNGAFKVSYI
jgi:phage terminase large subunit-like protein